jgi:hypothetical protein
MTVVAPDKPWYKKPFKLIPLTSPFVELIRPFTKWFFDVLKNLIAATAVIYFGHKTGNIELKILGYFAAYLIAAYFLSYTYMWRIEFFFEKKNTALSILGGLLYVAILSGVVWGCSIAINRIITDITQAQAK